MIANPQQTDTVQQFLAYEKCYKITGGYQNCVSAHEPLSYTRQVSAHQELLGRDRTAPAWPRSRWRRARSRASRSASQARARRGEEAPASTLLARRTGCGASHP